MLEMAPQNGGAIFHLRVVNQIMNMENVMDAVFHGMFWLTQYRISESFLEGDISTVMKRLQN